MFLFTYRSVDIRPSTIVLVVVELCVVSAWVGGNVEVPTVMEHFLSVRMLQKPLVKPKTRSPYSVLGWKISGTK